MTCLILIILISNKYQSELQLNKAKANSFDTKSVCFDSDLSIMKSIVSSQIYDKRDDFNIEIINFPFLDEDVPRSSSYGVYSSQLTRFVRVCSNVSEFNNCNKNRF